MNGSEMVDLVLRDAKLALDVAEKLEEGGAADLALVLRTLTTLYVGLASLMAGQAVVVVHRP